LIECDFWYDTVDDYDYGGDDFDDDDDDDVNDDDDDDDDDDKNNCLIVFLYQGYQIMIVDKYATMNNNE